MTKLQQVCLRFSFSALVAVGLVVATATVAQAVTRNWTGGSGNWSPGNWSPAGVPSASDPVNIVFNDATSRTVTLNTSTPGLGLVSIDNDGTGTSTLLIPTANDLTAGAIAVGGYTGSAFTNGQGAMIHSAGTTTISPGGDLILAWGAGSTGTYTLSGGALTANQAEWVGYSGNGIFNHTGGTNTINASALGSLIVGHNAGVTGLYNLSETGSLVSNESEYIGNSGTGFFQQTGGSNLISGNNLYLGYNASGSGTYHITGGTLTVGNDVVVGNSGSGSMTILDDGSVFVNNSLSINGLSTVHLNGGTLRFNTATGLNRLNYNAGTIQLAGTRAIGTDPTITALFGTSATISSGKGLTIEGDAWVEQTVRVNGGSMSSQNELVVGRFNYGVLEITNGGTVTNGEGSIGFYDVIGEVTVSGPGSTWINDGDLWVGRIEPAAQYNILNIRDGALVYVAETVQLQGVVNLDGGTIRFNDLSIANFNNIGTFNFNAGTIQLAGNRVIGTDEVINDLFGAAPLITAAKNLTVEGTATLLTPVTLDGGTLTVGQLASASELQLQHGTLNVTNQALAIGPSGLLGSTLDVNDDMTVNVTLGITNQGLVTGDGQIGGTFANAASGELRGEPGRSLKLTGANNTNAGQISLYGGMLDFTQNLTNNAGAFISGNGTIKATAGLTNNGTMNFSGLANVVGDLTNSAGGKIISSGGGPTTFLDDVVNNGEIRTTAGSYTVIFGAATGSGSYTGLGTVNFEGDLKPGSSPAAVNFAGDVVFGPDAALVIELGGTTPGSQYDQINVAGELTLDGTLEISLINGFTPSAGQSFDILNWGSLAGAFSSFDLPALPGLAWNTSQLATGILSVAIPGDFNLDGTVDAADYVVWRKNPGGIYTQNDFHTWRANFGQTAGFGSGATGSASANPTVPEPTTFVMLIVAATAVSTRRRWRAWPVSKLNDV